MTNDDRLALEAVLRVGEVTAVNGRRISITVDREKNLSELFFDGDVLKNVSVGGYIDIRKGFLSLIGKVEGEIANFESEHNEDQVTLPNSKRVLSVSLVGFLDRSGDFSGGTRELPLVGNEAFLLTTDKLLQIHNIAGSSGMAMNIATSDYEGYEVSLPVDTLMNSHIAIFGNTGSGKSNTLAILYQHFIRAMRDKNENAFSERSRIMIIDFNGEYTKDDCITLDKHVYRLSTRTNDGDKIPLNDEGFLDIELLSILADATEKTQKPFLTRALRQHTNVMSSIDPLVHIKNILRSQVKRILQLSDKVRADLLMDYLRQVLPEIGADGEPVEISEDLEWNNTLKEYMFGAIYLGSNPDSIPDTIVHKHVDMFEFDGDVISDFLTFCYVQLIYDILSNRAQNEHVAPVINKLRSKQPAIRKIFDPAVQGDIFRSNVIVISLHDVNLEMKKTIPLLICRKAYHKHRMLEQASSLNIVIDEAHNILSKDSFRESESWKDYRLETFEEIIKEGRKFGVFVTLASQRPSDISSTITSQAHNFFIHRLVNERDLQSISNAVSYIDKLTEESIPTLPVGTCIFSGIAAQMPLRLAINPLDENSRPESTTLSFGGLAEEN